MADTFRAQRFKDSLIEGYSAFTDDNLATREAYHNNFYNTGIGYSNPNSRNHYSPADPNGNPRIRSEIYEESLVRSDVTITEDRPESRNPGYAGERTSDSSRMRRGPVGHGELIIFPPGTRISHKPKANGETVNANNVLDFIVRDGQAVEKPIEGIDYSIQTSAPSIIEQIDEKIEDIAVAFNERYDINPGDSFIDANIKVAKVLPGEVANNITSGIDNTVNYVSDRFVQAGSHVVGTAPAELKAAGVLTIVGLIAAAIIVLKLK